MAPPNTFDDPLERWVYEQRAASVVYVEFRPDPDLVYGRWNQVHPLPEGEDQEGEIMRRQQESALTMYATAFFVPNVKPDDGLGVFLLTSAHVLAPVFSQEMPLTADDLNELYHTFILCDHRDQRYLKGLANDGERLLRSGRVHQISCNNDLLLLRIARHAMKRYCDQPHPPMPIATLFPNPLSKVVMISCPGVGRSLTSVIGHVSRSDRLIQELAEESNHFGFTMNLSEVDITSESGSSGGPLLNGEADVCGVLHGGNKRFSYFVGLPESRVTLTAWAVIPEAE